jgi:hypothetical protein
VALLNDTNVFTGTNRFTGAMLATNVNSRFVGDFNGDGAGLSNLPPAGINGVLATTQIPILDAGTKLTGTLADARLSANVALLNDTNVFTGTNRFTGAVLATNVNSRFVGDFNGDGAGLSNLPPAGINGVLATTQIPTLDAGTKLSGTLADARLTGNVALLNRAVQAFTGGTNSFSGNVGIGVSSPSAPLHINGGVKVNAANTLELGAGVAGKEANAGKLGYQVFTTNALDIVGAGTSGTNRQIKFWAEGGSTFSGEVTATVVTVTGGSDVAEPYQVASAGGWNPWPEWLFPLTRIKSAGCASATGPTTRPWPEFSAAPTALHPALRCVRRAPWQTALCRWRASAASGATATPKPMGPSRRATCSRRPTFRAAR